MHTRLLVKLSHTKDVFDFEEGGNPAINFKQTKRAITKIVKSNILFLRRRSFPKFRSTGRSLIFADKIFLDIPVFPCCFLSCVILALNKQLNFQRFLNDEY